MTPDPRAAAVASRAAAMAAAAGVDLPDDLWLWSLTPRPTGEPPSAGAPDDLGRGLEASTPDDDRARRGQHFTPPAMADELVTAAWPADGRPRVGDPACGGGALLLAAARRLEGAGLARGDVLDRLWGADLDPLAVATTEAALTLWAGRRPPPGHLVVADTLVDDLA